MSIDSEKILFFFYKDKRFAREESNDAAAILTQRAGGVSWVVLLHEGEGKGKLTLVERVHRSFLHGKLPFPAVAVRLWDQPVHRCKLYECDWCNTGDAAHGSCPFGDYPGWNNNSVDSVLSQGGSHH